MNDRHKGILEELTRAQKLEVTTLAVENDVIIENMKYSIAEG